jgi:hypothetical protein
MERTVVDPLVEDYLRRLDAAAYPLGEDRRGELMAGIREHIEAAIESGEAHDEASLRALLDRLGDPDEIVAAARDDGSGGTPYPLGTAAPVTYRRAGIGLEITAALFLTVGSVLLVVGWLVGVVLVWSSRRWTLGEKLVATLVFPGGPTAALFLAGIAAGTSSCSSFSSTDEAGNVVQGPTTCTSTGLSVPPWLGLTLFAAWVILPIVVAGVLVMRARRRADAEPPVPVTVSPGAAARWGGLEIAAVLLLALGAFVVPVVGPAAGVLCAWLSDQWTRTEKWVATAIASVGLVIPLVLAIGGLLAVRSS